MAATRAALAAVLRLSTSLAFTEAGDETTGMELDGTPTGKQVHLVALPHTHLTKSYDWCAYTAKLRRFTHMVVASNRTPVVYGPEEHDCAPGTQYVPIVTAADRQAWFGAPDWDREQVFDGWDVNGDHWWQMNRRAATEIAERFRPGDILGLIAGLCQQPIVARLADRDIHPLVWEWGIGYSGVLDGSHKTYESYAWAHHVAGLRHQDDIRFFDSVIPNCFDRADFSPSFTQGDYLLFMGRPTPRKGLPILEEIAKRVDVPLLIAGQPGVEIPGSDYVGIVTGQPKADLLAGAYAVLTPTTYLEPFGGVAVEAMLSGTPVIASDWGAFTETVQHGTSGFRCRTLNEFLTAVESVPTLDRRRVLQYATNRFSLEQGARMYRRVLDQLDTLYGDGWYTTDIPVTAAPPMRDRLRGA